MTSKEYSINCHILFKYSELAFLQLQLVQILFKLIIILVNYKKKQKGVPFYETPCISTVFVYTFAVFVTMDTFFC